MKGTNLTYGAKSKSEAKYITLPVASNAKAGDVFKFINNTDEELMWHTIDARKHEVEIDWGNKTITINKLEGK